MVDRNLKQWRDIVEYVNRRRQAKYDEDLIGEVGDNFEYNRSRVIQSVGKNASDVVRNYDRERESEQIALSLPGRRRPDGGGRDRGFGNGGHSRDGRNGRPPWT